PGQMWEAFRRSVEQAGIPVRLNHRCVSLSHSGGRVERLAVKNGAGEKEHAVDGVLSSIPLSELVQILEPSAPDAVLAAAARIGLIDPSRVIDGVKIRVPKAYPMYVEDFREDVAIIRGYLETFENLKTFGRNGLHRYNNQDHSMWTAILATLNLIAGTSYDVWSVNTEAEYHEEGEAVEAALAPEFADVLS